MTSGAGLRWVHLLYTVLAAVLVSMLVWTAYTRRGALVPAPLWLSVAMLALMGVLVLVVGWPVRRFQEGKGLQRFSALRAARALVLAQAGALTGAAVFGWYAGHTLIIAPQLDLHVYQRQLWPLVALLVLSSTVVGVGMLVQSWCRVEPPQDEPPGAAAA